MEGEKDLVAGQGTEELGGEKDLADPHTSEIEREDITGLGERVRRAPRWMEDYISGDGIPDESNLACFMVHDDPICFVDAVKEQK